MTEHVELRVVARQRSVVSAPSRLIITITCKMFQRRFEVQPEQQRSEEQEKTKQQQQTKKTYERDGG
jgi:hypothetical protein